MSNLPILHPSREAKREKVETMALTSTFQDFMSSLQSNEEQSALRSMHSALWSTLPMERLVTDGAWLLVSAVAQKYGLKLATRDDIRNVADRVNRLLGVGLLLSYGTAEKAAEAFAIKVVGGLNRAIGLGYRPGQTLSGDAWRALIGGNDILAKRELRGQKVPSVGSLSAFFATPCYLFLADCFKAARTLGDDLKAGQAEFMARNWVTGIAWNRGVVEERRDVVYRAEIDLADTIDFLNPLSKTEWGTFNRNQISYALQARAKLAKANLRLSVWLVLPIKFVGVPRAMMFMKGREIGQMWITAQIMRAVGEKKIGELHAHYPQGSALKKIRLAGPAVLIDQLTEVALARGTKWSADQLACFRLMVAEQLDSWLDWEDHHQVALKAAGLVRKTADQLQVNPRLALLIVMGQAPEAEPIINQLGFAEADNFLRREVLPRVDWSVIDIERLKLILQPHGRYAISHFNYTWVARNIPKMSRRLWTQATDLLLGWSSDPVMVAMLAKKRLITFDLEFFQKHRALIPTGPLVDLLGRELLVKCTPSEVIARLGVRHLVLAFVTQLPDVTVKRIWQQPIYQTALLELVRVLHDQSQLGQHQIDENILSKLIFQQVGWPIWQSYVARL